MELCCTAFFYYYLKSVWHFFKSLKEKVVQGGDELLIIKGLNSSNKMWRMQLLESILTF